MNDILQNGIRQYRSRIAAKQRFEVDCRRVRQIAAAEGPGAFDVYFSLLTPLLDVAWVDGRIRRNEQDAILEASAHYGLDREDAQFIRVMEAMTTRATPRQSDERWETLAKWFRSLPVSKAVALASHLLEQTRYVARLGQEAFFGLWRGHDEGANERSAVEETTRRLRRLESEASVANMESDDVLKLLPLVEVAWADGRISKKERRFIFDSLFDLGIEPTNDNIHRLAAWLRLKPDQAFIDESVARLARRLGSLSPDERASEKYSLLSTCADIAEASGSMDRRLPGHRICEEEKLAVKRIASLLNLREPVPALGQGGSK